MLECLHPHESWLFPKWSERDRERESTRRKLCPFYDVVSEVTCLHFCHILFVESRSLTPSLYSRGGQLGTTFWREKYPKICRHMENHHSPQGWSGKFQIVALTCWVSGHTYNRSPIRTSPRKEMKSKGETVYLCPCKGNFPLPKISDYLFSPVNVNAWFLYANYNE